MLHPWFTNGSKTGSWGRAERRSRRSLELCWLPEGRTRGAVGPRSWHLSAYAAYVRDLDGSKLAAHFAGLTWPRVEPGHFLTLSRSEQLSSVLMGPRGGR
jgi:hypothetical protein